MIWLQVQQKQLKKDILVVGVDGIGEAYDSIRAGKLDATVDSFGYYMSQVATEVTLRVLAGQDIPRVTHTPQALIDKTNVDKDAKDIIGWTDPKYVSEQFRHNNLEDLICKVGER